ncbi:MAG: L-threonylcarbamoyladenylate synthase [Accumulibacter sp.]|jgi:L-threonylcarbamoyladenylate synthase|uniref:L-threonylcarbamoyladenylate synthase n=1 Tax=Accumulibacter sp. TaxID=2053492 RepID=UPI002FC29FE1
MRPEKNDLDRAVALLQAGELVAFPTETVYGLGADAANPAAVARIFAAKRRPADHPLIVHLPADGYLDRWARDIPSVAWELAEAFWPGPLTLILKCAAAVPKVVTGGQDSVGLRVPAHPLALDLLRAYARAGGGLAGMGGIAAPSANRFGRISPTAAAHVREELGDAVPLILDGGRCPVGIESTILDLTPGESLPPRLLRPGRITHEQIATVIGVMPQIVTRPPDGGMPRVSGSLAAHYAPTTPLRLLPCARLVEVIDLLQRTGQRCAVLCHSRLPATLAAHACRRLPANPRAYASALYAALRELDQADAELILVEEIPATPVWAAVADRLQRAAAGSGASGA